MQIKSSTRVFAVLGDPIAHSLSPVMHNLWLSGAGIDAVYVALRVGEEGLSTFAHWGLAGANVTAPFKASALRSAVHLSADAARLGAVNTLRRDTSGAWCGENTDGAGFVLGLDQAVPGWKAGCQTALILGAGGAGRAIAWGLAQAGLAQIAIANRSFARARDAGTRLGLQAIAWEQAAQFARRVDLVINATHQDVPIEALEPILAAAPAGAIACDALYRPRHTPFLLAAQQKGMACMDGLFMLAGQGALAFAHWFDILPDQQLARAAMLQALGEEETQ